MVYFFSILSNFVIEKDFKARYRKGKCPLHTTGDFANC